MSYTIRDLFCVNCHHEHTIIEGTLICSERFCSCNNFTNKDALILTQHQKALDNLKKVTEKIQYMYEVIKGFENYSNKSFVFAYWHLNNNFITGMILDGRTYHELEDPEVIRRTRQKFVEKNPQYQTNDPTKIYGKAVKFNAIMEFVTQ